MSVPLIRVLMVTVMMVTITSGVSVCLDGQDLTVKQVGLTNNIIGAYAAPNIDLATGISNTWTLI